MNKSSVGKRKNGIPVLSKDEIDNIGEQFVAEYCPNALISPMALEIDDFTQSFLGLKQDYQYLSHNGTYLGMIVFEDTHKIPVFDPLNKRAEYISAQAGTIIIDAGLLEEEQERRYRFTVGHEAAHSILHSEYFTNRKNITGVTSFPSVKCRVNDSRMNKIRISAWSDYDWMEWQADRLSSAILMPASMVRKIVEQDLEENSAFKAAGRIISVHQKFNVSIQAAEIRLRELGLIKEFSQYDIQFELSFYVKKMPSWRGTYPHFYT